jgi:hypothetical protein
MDLYPAHASTNDNLEDQLSVSPAAQAPQCFILEEFPCQKS